MRAASAKREVPHKAAHAGGIPDPWVEHHFNSLNRGKRFLDCHASTAKVAAFDGVSAPMLPSGIGKHAFEKTAKQGIVHPDPCRRHEPEDNTGGRCMDT
ncbi:hypothetical protein BLTE_07430 [Blastochloris tepida]|uniref:Uncharacterized protein n=1 Tax=Blastochloris tepida TaxID=2233851 RepID=A0A348FXM5_9HYPH|nr:hypothetical protein BLTE_07430 [Blastochloris tepida]